MMLTKKISVTILFFSFFYGYSQENNNRNMNIDDIRELEQERISDISNTVKLYVEELENKFDIKLDYKNVSTLDKFEQKIHLYGLEKLNEKD